MSRLVVLTLIVALCDTSVAFAGETLLGASTRVAREVARSQARPQTTPAGTTAVQKHWAGQSLASSMLAKSPSSALGQEAPALSTSGMSKGKKFLIFLGAAVGIAATAYVIDHKVEDNTPSSLGTRED